MMTMKRREEGEHGYVMVWMALLLVALIAGAAFSIDVGAWYARSAQIQRAAEAAAKAGVIYMPDTGLATAEARKVARKNGFDAASVAVVPQGQDSLKVTITDSDAPRYFSAMFLGPVTIRRPATAQYLREIPLGSPFNSFGAGISPLRGIPRQNYWAAINGWCTAKEDGDMLASRMDGNKSSTAHDCDDTDAGTELNGDYNAGGYEYNVFAPPISQPIDIRIFDACFAPYTRSAVTGNTSPDKDPRRTSDVPPHITTTFTVFNTMETVGRADDVQVKQMTVGTVGDLAGGISDVDCTGNLGNQWVAAWGKLYQIPAVSGAVGKTYRVQVQTKANEPRSYGVNAYGLQATSYSFPLNQGCDSRGTNACPRVYGTGAISLYADINPSTPTATEFYLAEVPPTYAGEDMTITLWDPGEGAQSIEILDPSGNPVNFTYKTDPEEPALGGRGNLLDVSGFGGPPPGAASGTRQGIHKYNDRKVELTVTVPASYANPANYGDKWWRVRYTIAPAVGTRVPSDRTTWLVRFEAGDPVRIVRNS